MLVGLGRAHELGVVHRDVKPRQRHAHRRQRAETVKLFDFGIASNERAAIKLTVPGTAFGTPEYIAPEQAMGLDVDARADLYAVGVVLFEMLCGRLPFVCKDDIAFLRAHIKEPPPTPSSVAPDAKISAAVDALVLRALDKDPEKRFANANEMIAAIDTAAGHKPLEAGGGGLAGLAARAHPRRRGAGPGGALRRRRRLVQALTLTKSRPPRDTAGAELRGLADQ